MIPETTISPQHPIPYLRSLFLLNNNDNDVEHHHKSNMVVDASPMIGRQAGAIIQNR